MDHEKTPIQKLQLHPPSLLTLADTISLGLSSNFAHSSCTIDTPPDLTLPPYYLAAPGLTGCPRIVDIGGPPNITPLPNKTKKYQFFDIARLAEMSLSSGFLLGAGAGPFHVLGQNSELMPNLAYGIAAGTADPQNTRNRTHYAKITGTNSICCAQVPNNTAECAFMCNLFCSDGLPGPCLHVTARGRTGALNFTESIQKALENAFGDKLLSLGGVFIIKRGTVKLHVMPDFSSKLLTSKDDVEEWLQYFDVKISSDSKLQDGPLVCLSVFHSGKDAGLDLRMEHTHCFTVSANHGTDMHQAKETTTGGHYHYDVNDTEEIEYEGWFNVADYLYRIDQPGKVA